MSFSETIFLFLLALIVFGPKKLPEIARQVGRYLNEFKRASNEFKAQIEQEIAHLEDETTPKILPPSTPPEGVMSRKPISTREASSQRDPEPAATLASPAPDAVAELNPQAPESASSATEGVATSDSVNSPTSQESHA
jgi:TatA/E family protein of Tat protein translocase